jgi:hypothetical protein
MKAPEPLALIGPSLSLICLVTRHPVPRGCPSTESDTNWECLWHNPLY